MTSSQGRKWLAPLSVAAAVSIAVAVVGGTLTDTGPWYQSLRKPSWQPPDWLFGPAWTLILSLAALAATVAWRDAPARIAREWVVGLFSLNGFLNVLWSLLFFGLRNPTWALIEVVFLWLSILLLIVFLWPWSRRASWLLMPYLIWVAFAAWLNLAIVRLN